ncbi:hypothetical protein SNOG_08413 [Parastagonospora nodorum SN15]|uniref:F-BAR domain-containing protein n=1 Tax=Phaeosphaeria nodorum (strain SN15 / ATCC MYA-4574 / FGSC 10173) TaxID=321614 RepID=Q0UIK1_PHANO|nr:hypothetical protein SNOG_08413 [Parastagonospora nodorum SN15]EAT84689.2 hypothetical protein SNOG_08413 [Parastagonospora nodorum SN15]
MGGTAATEPPSVSLSFANNFWGKDDAGVGPMLDRMHNAKVCNDELKNFYAARAAIEDEYARKLLNLSRKPLGSAESGTLRLSCDVIRAEVESMGKAHQSIAQQMKTELEEPLAAFAGGMKERRKIVQNGIEKLLKLKMQQTSTVNKARDRYEQDCLKIKGFLAQAHMVMGHEERKNKAKLEKTQINLSTTSSEYEAAVKVLEETTGRWNRDWKAACDKFQDLEEERIDYTKSSLWNFANIASTVCVSDDASCEKMRLSLEDCDVEKDITGFIKDLGTGQEIPDPPKFINFCRGDAETSSQASEDENYSVAQFARTMNPAYRASSPQPSMFESHHDPNNPLAKELGLQQDTQPIPIISTLLDANHKIRSTLLGANLKIKSALLHDRQRLHKSRGMSHRDNRTHLLMTLWMLRPDTREGPLRTTSTLLHDASPGKPMAQSPMPEPSPIEDMSKKRGFFNSPFARRKKPVDPRANFQLNVGNNVFDVASPDKKKQQESQEPQDELDPIAQALEELKVVTKQTSQRVTADRYHGLATPAPPATPAVGANLPGGAPTPLASASINAAKRGTPPPSYEQPPMSRLGAPKPAHTSRQMQKTTQMYVNQKVNMFNGGADTRSSSRSPTKQEPPRVASPAPPPPPAQAYGTPVGRNSYTSTRGASPTVNAMPRAASPQPPPQPTYAQTQASQSRPASRAAPSSRAVSPQPAFRQSYDRPSSSRGSEKALSIAAPSERGEGSVYGGSVRGRGNAARPQSSYYGGSGSSEFNFNGGGGGGSSVRAESRVRSKSLAEPKQYNRDGRIILNYWMEANMDTARAMYSYNAQIPEELGFQKGDILAVLRLQDDGWWEAEAVGKNGRPGLVPSNYLQAC